MSKIDKGIRLTNYLIDFSIIVIIWIIISIISKDAEAAGIVFYILTFLYYFIMEFFLGQTIGKIVTKTVVVKKSGLRASLLNIIIRTTCRLIPIDGFSYLFGTERGFHDVLSSTRLTKKTR
ncbi:MAG: hypothetical protein DWP94_02930 [Flavobacterium sp.]|nr:MAG: hypothetical protein DWP94_02930 [Flavobacterium sp.]